MKQNYPNPFNPSTTIEFDISKTENVNLSVFNLKGQLIATLVNEELAPAAYKAVFDASNLPSGIYFYILRAGSFKLQKKMIVTK